MAFAGHCGLELNLDALADSAAELPAVLFSEELGAVVQVARDDLEEVLAQFSAAGLGDCLAVVGQPQPGNRIRLTLNGAVQLEAERSALQRKWAETSYRIQRLRDNAECADQEYDALLDEENPGLNVRL